MLIQKFWQLLHNQELSFFGHIFYQGCFDRCMISACANFRLWPDGFISTLNTCEECLFFCLGCHRFALTQAYSDDPWRNAGIWLKLLLTLLHSFWWSFQQHGPCDEGQEGCHEGHEGSKGHDEGRSSWWVGHCNWAQEIGHFQGPEHFGWDWHRRGEEVWQVRSSRAVHDQDSPESSNQGWQEVDVRPGGDGEGPACEDCGEGIPCGKFEARILRSYFFDPWSCSLTILVAPWGIGARLACEGAACCTLSHAQTIPRWDSCDKADGKKHCSRLFMCFCIHPDRSQLIIDIPC